MKILIFFLMLLPPPNSTLVPSPTLFRSRLQRLVDVLPALPLAQVQLAGELDLCRVDAHTPELQSARQIICSPPRETKNCTCADRKSTRLNSSHRYISHAGFCRNKQKNNL